MTMDDVSVIPYITAAITFSNHTSVWKSIFNVHVLLFICIAICEASGIIIILQVRQLQFTEVGRTHPRSPCWYVAHLTLVSQCTLSTSYVPTELGLAFVIFSFLYSFPWGAGLIYC